VPRRQPLLRLCLGGWPLCAPLRPAWVCCLASELNDAVATVNTAIDVGMTAVDMSDVGW